MNFYYLGLKEQTINNSNFFKRGVVLRNSGGEGISYQKIYNKDIDYNDLSNFASISKFYDQMITKIESEDANCKFMLYNQASLEFMSNLQNIICCNDIQLIKSLNNKPVCRNLLGDITQSLEYKYLKGKDVNFEYINNLFDNKFEKYVIQQPVGFGGVGTFILEKSNNIVNMLKSDVTYSISAYVEAASPINNTFMISDNYIHVFNGSFQLINSDKELTYNGWDFNLYNKLSNSSKKKIYDQTLIIAKKLQLLGYRGVGGVDYLLKDDQLYFMEINPRFQASSEELDKMLIEQGYPSIFELNYLAFYDDKKFVEICKNNKTIDEYTKIKIDLMMNGVCLNERVKDYLVLKYGKKFYNDDYVTTTGIMMELNNNVFATVHLNNNSTYKIELINNKLFLTSNSMSINMPINIWNPSDFMADDRKNENGLITNYVNAHFDRARLNPISGCNNHCAFCSMNGIQYKRNSINEMSLALKEALKDKRITHILISGGSPKEEDLPYLTEVYEYFCNNFDKYDIDVMMTPRGFDSYSDASQYEKYIKYLKEIGVKGLSINLELFNDELCAKYCREKYLIGKENYLTFLQLASKIFGTENVRSGLIVGLESKEDTLKAVEEICKCGCMPMLSPYIPYNGIGNYPTAQFLIDVYEETNKILKKYNIPLAPLCKKCKHNTL